jgi:hypothetical protein
MPAVPCLHWLRTPEVNLRAQAAERAQNVTYGMHMAKTDLRQRDMMDRASVLGIVAAGITLLLILYPPHAQRECNCTCQAAAGRHLLQNAPDSAVPAAPAAAGGAVEGPSTPQGTVEILIAAVTVLVVGMVGEVWRPCVELVCTCVSGLENNTDVGYWIFRLVCGGSGLVLAIVAIARLGRVAGWSLAIVAGIGIVGFALAGICGQLILRGRRRG